MKYSAYCIFLFLTLLVSGCKDDASLESFRQESKLVVYSFPTIGDTTYIHVTRSVPIRDYADSVQLHGVDHATVVYTVNDVPCPVTSLGNGYYRVTGHQRAGDNVTLRVKDGSADEVTAHVAIPDTVAVSEVSIRDVKLFDEYSSTPEPFNQISVTFTDDAATHSYYAVRVKQSLSYGDTVDESKVSYVPLDTWSESLLSSLSDIDSEFGFSDDYFANFYIFDDTDINGRTYTLHLNVSPYVGLPVDNVFYQVELMRITPEFYHFMQALNQIENDELARGGLSQIRPTVTNVAGGLGLVGGWNGARTEWIK